MVLIGIVALPFVEDRLLITGKSEENKILGGVLLIVGIVIWIACGINWDFREKLLDVGIAQKYPIGITMDGNKIDAILLGEKDYYI